MVKTDKVVVQVSMPLGLKEQMEQTIKDEELHYLGNSGFIRDAIRRQIEEIIYLNGLRKTLDNLDANSPVYDKKYMELATALFSSIGDQAPKMLLVEKRIFLQFHRSLIGHVDERMDELERKLMNWKEWSDLDESRSFSK